MSISTAAGIIAIRAPQWGSDPRISDMIELATMQTGDCFGDRKQLAIALRVLHMFAKEAIGGGNPGTGTTGGSGVAGSVRSEKEGDLARSYGLSASASNKNSSDLTSTAFGLELLELIDSTFFLPRTSYMAGCENGTNS